MKHEMVEITPDEIKALRNSLKRVDKRWAKNLAERINKRQSKVKVDETKIYNIVNGGTKHQSYYVLFAIYGKELLTEKTDELAKAKEAINA